MPDRPVPTDTRVDDLNSRRRCQRCNRRLVKRDYNQPTPVVTWGEDGIRTETVATKGMVVWACAVCDFGGSCD